MKNFLKLGIFLTLLFFYSGCIEIKTLITVNEDGSGTIEETLLMSSEIVKMIEEFATAFDADSTNPEKFELYDIAKLKEEASDFGGGVNYLSSESLVVDDRQGYKAVYSFNDLNNLQIDQNPSSQMPIVSDETGSEEEGEKEIVTFQFIKGSPSEILIKMPPQKFNEDTSITTNAEIETDTSVNQEEEELLRLMKDLSITLMINVEGNITETNATYVDKSTITLFKINFNEIIDNEERFDAFIEKDPQNMEELKNLIKDMPGIKIELNDPVRIKFN